MGPAVYILGALTTLACATLLFRGYFRARKRLLLWSGLCFAGLAASNFMIFVDLIMIPDTDIFVWRLTIAAISMALLIYGLIWDSR